MLNISNYKKMSYNEALTSIEARNCGIYIVFEADEIIYVGKASGVTLKRRLAEHVSYDNQFNTLTKKIGRRYNMPLTNCEEIFEYIAETLQFVLIPFPVHSYNDNGYSYNVELRNSIISSERDLITKYKPLLNTRL